MRIIIRVSTALLILLLFGCSSGSGQAPQKYFTWDGLEPDKWASIWLLKRHIDPLSEIMIVPVGAEARNAIAIDTPYAEFKRTHGVSTFESMILAFNKDDDPGLVQIGEIINKLEVSPWTSSSPVVDVVEQQFRALQLEYNRVDVPATCYSGFFDQLYSALTQADEVDLEGLFDQLGSKNVCTEPTSPLAERKNVPVFEYSIKHILKMIDTGKRVIFVDTREDEEYDEAHIPGSINIKLREVNAAAAKQLEGADLVISYCVKDFRGYEVALALSQVGVKNVGIMKPYGISGWKGMGLPVTHATDSGSIALERLMGCAANGRCDEPT